MKYYDYPGHKPKRGQMCLCRCSNWCHEGYQIATFDGTKFDYADSPNEDFNDNVEAFMPLDEDGEPEERKHMLPKK